MDGSVSGQLATRQGYDAWAPIYDADGNPVTALEEPQVRGLLGDVAGLEVLDVGSGTGRHAHAFAAQGAHVTGIDFSPGMLEIARQKPGTSAIRFMEQDLTQPLPFPAATFDRALLCLVIEHLEHPVQLLREVHRVLRPGGFLVCSGMHPAMHLKGVQARFIDPGTGERIEVAGFRHQVLDYVGAAVRAGFSVDHISEHRADEELARRLPRAARYVGHPMVLIMRLFA